MNATESTQNFEISASGLPGISVKTDVERITIDPTQSRWIAVRVQLPYEGATAGSHPFNFEITAQSTGDKIIEKSVFIVPR